MLAALRRGRYGYRLALYILLCCAAEHNPTTSAALILLLAVSCVPHRAGLEGRTLGLEHDVAPNRLCLEAQMNPTDGGRHKGCCVSVLVSCGLI